MTEARLRVHHCLAVAALALWGCGSEESSGGTGGQPSGGAGGAGGAAGSGGTAGGALPPKVRIAQFNLREMSTAKLLDGADEQAGAAAQVIAKFAPEIISINELQFDIEGIPSLGSPGAPSSTQPGTFDGGAQNAKRLAERVAALNPAAAFSFTVLTVGNSGFKWAGPTLGNPSFVLRGWGDWPGRFNSAILTKFPIAYDKIRVINEFAWDALPDNSIDKMKTEIGTSVPAGFPLFEKGILVVPVEIAPGQLLHMVMHHPVAPAFEAINPYRHFDELHGLKLFLDGTLPGVEPLPVGARFVVIGDLNADPEDGDSLDGGIEPILGHPALNVFFPAGSGTKGTNGKYNTYLSGCGKDDGTTVDDPTTKFQMQLDYILPSKTFGAAQVGEIFFPDFQSQKADFLLACQASDHRFLYVDVETGK